MPNTTLDAKIARLEAALKNAKAEKTKQARRERNQQLIAFGIGLELKYKSLSPMEKENIKSWFIELDDRNKIKAFAGFSRLDSLEKENPSVLPTD